MNLKSYEDRKEEYKHKLENLTMMSDILARNVMKDKDCCKHILRIIMNDKKIEVIENNIQADYKNLYGRSVILDCVIKTGDEKNVDVEIQQENEGANPKRARYHLGLMDMNALEAGDDFNRLPETYIIFITLNDALKYNLPIVHVNRIIAENGEQFQDGSHIIYVDSSKEDETELGQLMHDFRCKTASEMKNQVLAKKLRELKETERGVEHMCREMEEIRAEGREEGRIEEKRKITKELFNDGMPIAKIAILLSASEETVQKWLL